MEEKATYLHTSALQHAQLQRLTCTGKSAENPTESCLGIYSKVPLFYIVSMPEYAPQ